NTFGVSVFTRPPRISGAPDQEEIGVTSTPAFFRWSAVPPVERISTPLARSAFARSTMPVLSETERIARSTAGATGSPPDERKDIRGVGHRMRVADGCDAERSGSIV